MVHVPKQKRKKLDAKSVKMIFVGFDGAGLALSSTVREIIWINQLKHELEEKSIGTTTIFCVNQSTIK